MKAARKRQTAPRIEVTLCARYPGGRVASLAYDLEPGWEDIVLHFQSTDDVPLRRAKGRKRGKTK